MNSIDRLRSWARWAPLVAAAGILSLGFLPLFRPGLDADEEDRRRLEGARDLIEDGFYARARDRMSVFLMTRTGSSRIGEAYFIQSEAVRRLAEEEESVSEPLLAEAWRKIRSAENHGYDPAEILAFRRSVAGSLLGAGRVERAAEYFQFLLETTGEAEDALKFAASLGAAAAVGRAEAAAQRDAGVLPAARTVWRPVFSDGLALADLALRALPPGARLPAHRTLAGMYGRLEDDEAIVRMIGSALRDSPGPGDRMLLRLDEAKALTRLGRKSDALSAFESVLAGLEEKEFEHDVALLWKAEVLARDVDHGCVQICEGLIERESPVAPLAFLVLARFERGAGLGDWADTFLRGAARIRRPDVFDRSGFRFDPIHEELKEILGRETNHAVLLTLARILKEEGRLFPDRLDLVTDRAVLWRRMGALLAEAAGAETNRGRTSLVEADTRAHVLDLERQWRGGGAPRVSLPGGVVPADELADRYGAAADAFVEIANASRAGEVQAGTAVRNAAEVCLAGGMFPRAAALYRHAYELQPGRREENLYWNAISLMRAGILGGDSSEPGALEVFEEYFHAARPANPRFSLALLSRGEILVSLDRRDDALDEFDRVLGDPALGIGPGTAVWAEALLSRGRTLLDLAVSARPAGSAGDDMWARRYRGNAVRDLNEYLERYSDEPGRLEGVIEANYLIARSEMEERDWKGALQRLDAIEAIAGPVSGDHPVVREALFLRGDLLLNDGRPDEARRAYDRAYRLTITSPERLRGLIGRARAHLLLGDRDGAVRDYENSLSIYNAVKEDLDASLAGFGARYFDEALQALQRELP